VRLLNPSPGEILDRLTILELKIMWGGKRSMDVTHFEAEKYSLIEVLKNWTEGIAEDCIGDGDRLDETLQKVDLHRNGLAAVNALLWDAEDEARRTPDTSAFKLAVLCKKIIRLNDARASHVRELDLLHGIRDGQEKIYAESK
jgi:hypothetical protein